MDAHYSITLIKRMLIAAVVALLIFGAIIGAAITKLFG